MSEPLISILIPVFNRERYIEECVRSAMRQTWLNIEIVVSDNCSTDGTWGICEALAREDGRVRLFRNETNIGPVRNWRRCIDAAQGEFGMLLFSDDALDPRFLEWTAPFLADSDVGFVFSAVRSGHGRTLYSWGARDGKAPSSRFLRDSMIHDGRLPCSPGSALFRMRDLDWYLSADVPSPTMTGFAAHGAGPDLLLLLKTAMQYRAVAHVAAPLVVFRDHAGSISRQRGWQKLDDDYAQARISFAARNRFPHLLNRAFGAHWVRQMKTAGRWIWPQTLAAKFLAPGELMPNYSIAFLEGIMSHGALSRLFGRTRQWRQSAQECRQPPATVRA